MCLQMLQQWQISSFHFAKSVKTSKLCLFTFLHLFKGKHGKLTFNEMVWYECKLQMLVCHYKMIMTMKFIFLLWYISYEISETWDLGVSLNCWVFSLMIWIEKERKVTKKDLQTVELRMPAFPKDKWGLQFLKHPSVFIHSCSSLWMTELM